MYELAIMPAAQRDYDKLNPQMKKRIVDLASLNYATPYNPF